MAGYSMTDMASGSNAAMTMMQNMGAAPLATDVGRAQAEAAIATAEKTKLSNLMAQTEFKEDKESKDKLNSLIKSPDYLTATDSEKQSKIGVALMEANKVEAGSKMIANAQLTASREEAAEAKRLDNEATATGKIYDVLSTVPENKVEEFFNKLPEKTKQVVISQVGPDVWNSFSPKEKLEASKNLAMTAKLKAVSAQGTNALLRAEYIADAAMQRSRMNNDAAMARKIIGHGDEDEQTWKQTTRLNSALNANDDAFRKQDIKFREQLDIAKKKTGFFAKKQDTDAYDSLVKQYDTFQRNYVDKQIRLYENAKEIPYDQRKEALDDLYSQKAKFKSEEPAASEKKTFPAKEEKKPAVTSNKYTEQNPAKPTSKEEYDKLPPNSYYMQDGVLKRKKG
jgi:hypothetical protein